jgi:predicted DNA-binding transcriptional regulator YafY
VTENKTERLLEVFLCLSQARRPVTKRQLREAIEDYAGAVTDAAFEKTFERDKAELRDLGVPLETLGEGEDEGYRVDLEAHALPPVTFTPAEAALLGLARRVWHEEGAAAADRALRKLEAVGVAVDPGALALVEPRLAGGEQAFAPIALAIEQRREVTFDYRPSGATATATRRLQPWGVVSRRGRWYVVGHDLDRQAPRAFRLDRIVGPTKGVGRRGAYQIPDGVDVTRLVSDSTTGEARPAVLRVREGLGHSIRRRATSVTPLGDGWDRVETTTTDEDRLAREVLSHGQDVVIEEPASARALVVAALTSLAGAGA